MVTHFKTGDQVIGCSRALAGRKGKVVRVHKDTRPRSYDVQWVDQREIDAGVSQRALDAPGGRKLQKGSNERKDGSKKRHRRDSPNASDVESAESKSDTSASGSDSDDDSDDDDDDDDR
jgi:hypothetical protein